MATEDLWRKNCIRTVSGCYVNILQPDPATINIKDVAHALSNMPRFGGHLPIFYSVAQHSLAVCNLVSMHTDDPTIKIQALLHDAAEAYLVDVPTPIKSNLQGYKDMEQNMLQVIMEKWSIPHIFHKFVDDADMAQLIWEWDTLMLGIIEANRAYTERPWEVKAQFVARFDRLLSEHRATM